MYEAYGFEHVHRDQLSISEVVTSSYLNAVYLNGHACPSFLICELNKKLRALRDR